LAWASVALWFIAVLWVTEQWRGVTAWRRGAARAGSEALVTTLLASLWFDSLGHGGWWLLFFLLGALAALPARWREADSGAMPPKRALLLGLVDVGRYVVAGALLVWRLA
jgi:hypothetical protein